MNVVRKLDVQVGEDLAGEVDAAVASGDYASTSEVVDEALRAWKRRRDAEVQRLRALWKEGIESGEPQPLTRSVIDEVIAEGRARAAARKGS